MAICSPSADLSYAQLDSHVQQQTRQFQQRGMRAGMRIGWLAEANFCSIIRFWAILRCGGTACPIHSALPSAAIEDVVRQASIDWLLDTDEDLSRSIDPRSVVPSVTVDRPLIQSSPATILFSSGSTGAPKAIAHELTAHLVSARGSNWNLPLKPGDKWLLSLPLFHISGLSILFRCALAGATLAVAARDQGLSEQIQFHRPTHLSFVPTQLGRLLASIGRAPEQLQGVLLGGAPASAELIDQAQQSGWPLLTTYGLTEMASQVTTTALPAQRNELRTAGRVLPGREVRISAEGQIHVRGATLMSGYQDGTVSDKPWGSNGWFATGDLGCWEDAGRLLVLGRLDNLFISGGENIYPEEIERELLELTGIRQAVVVPLIDPTFGLRPVAFVDAELWSVEGWRKSLAQRLPRFKLPDHFLAWPTQSGLKPNRRTLQELARQQQPSWTQPLKRPPPIAGSDRND